MIVSLLILVFAVGGFIWLLLVDMRHDRNMRKERKSKTGT